MFAELIPKKRVAEHNEKSKSHEMDDLPPLYPAAASRSSLLSKNNAKQQACTNSSGKDRESSLSATRRSGAKAGAVAYLLVNHGWRRRAFSKSATKTSVQLGDFPHTAAGASMGSTFLGTRRSSTRTALVWPHLELSPSDMLQLLPRRQVSHNEQCERVVLRERKTSDGALEREYSNGTVTLERKTRHGSVISIESTASEPSPEGSELKKTTLVDELKKQVKHIMQQSANGRSVYIHSPSVTALCYAVENCLLDGLKRRLLGLFGGRSTFALLHSLSKHCAAGATVLQLTQAKQEHLTSQTGAEVLWIRVALQEKVLCVILDFIFSAHHCRRFYEKDALIVDPVKGGMIAAMLVGPCALDYSMLRTVENGWSDPTADELVQRHRIHSCASIPSPSPKRPSLSVMRRGNSIVRSADVSGPPAAISREHVSALHQNIRSSLLYGKNNVGVVLSPDVPQPMKGYLSLHQANTGALTIKWTPNQLMHSSSQPSSAASPSLRKCDNHFLWRHAINLPVGDVIYIHLHQSAPEDGAVSVVFVDTDGVQHPPLHFPPGQHALSFLSCLESGLQPFSVLDPPLWFHREKGQKVFPRLRRRTSIQSTSSASSFDGESSSAAEIHDYVFRIIAVAKPERQEPMMEDFVDEEEPPEVTSPKQCTSLPITPHPLKKDGAGNAVDLLVRNNLINACTSMRKQIASRAFLGWLAYCRHMRTVRTSLASLVSREALDASRAPGQVDAVFWDRCRAHRSPELEREFFYRTYLYGIQDDLRARCWPYLLGFARWTEDVDEKLVQSRFQYEQEVADWGRLEAIVRQRDKEAFHAARQRQMSTNGDLTYPLRVASINNEVFEEEAEAVEAPSSNGPECIRSTESVDEVDMVAMFGTNLHRIEKDVDRCDRNTAYFRREENLEKLKRVICTFVWRHMDEGYVQGMCDLAAVLLVIFDNEVLALECFERLMLRLRPNFPLGSGMDENLNNLRSLVQVMDPELFDLMMSNGDFTHLYFSYRWFLLDFKRELVYEHVYKLWETIWAASLTVSAHFHLFFALALLSSYRNILLENSMDFTDVIKFFNEMAERHDAVELLTLAREQLRSLQDLVNELK
uniref:Rab-GAP TBC domain-containing protein n=1 Tax=Steinernema glaseri TaxID=37863 RepID=A0A1I7XZL9_9BILA